MVGRGEPAGWRMPRCRHRREASARDSDILERLPATCQSWTFRGTDGRRDSPAAAVPVFRPAGHSRTAVRATRLCGTLDRVSGGVVAGQQVESDGAAVADDSACQAQESEEVGSLAFVAADQTPEPGGPLQAAFDDVSVPAEPG